MIVGVVGFIGSGKGTVADLLVEKHNFEKLSFADSVKDATAAMFGWSRHLLEGNTEESRKFRECRDPFWSKKFDRDFTPREALQLMGTEAGRNDFHQDLCIYTLERKLSNLINIPVVIPDVRFPNEIKFIRDQGGFVIRVKRGPEPEFYDELTSYYSDKNWYGASPNKMMYENYPKVHYSEWAWIGTHFDYVLHNEGSIHELETNLKFCLTLFEGPRRMTA